jgi:hypothetical protein
MDIFDMFFGGGHRGTREKRTKDMVYPLRGVLWQFAEVTLSGPLTPHAATG